MARLPRLLLRRRILTAAFAFVNLFLLLNYMLPRHRSYFRHGRGLQQDSMQKQSDKRILIVSSMFMLNKSKHSPEGYHDWLTRFLGPITTEVYFYTSPDFASTVLSARGKGLPLTIDTTYNSVFDVPPLKGREADYEALHKIDREHWYHSAELYAVWNAKPFFLDNAVRVMEERGFTFDYVFWSDGGSFREIAVYKDWPSPERVEEVWKEGSRLTGTPMEDLLFYPMCGPPDEKYRTWKESDGPIDTDFSEGSFFGGTPKTVAWWARTFYAYHDHYLKQGLFVGKDQTVFNALFLLFPERIFTVWMSDEQSPARDGLLHYAPSMTRGTLGSCGPEWFYYQYWLSDPRTQAEQQDVWLTHDREPEQARWWKIRTPCRVTNPLAMLDVLQRPFGDNWKPPRATIPTPRLQWQT
ncbi:hypothetical protein B0H34DRAFT_440207 [Crassisporium funariophilum]|nr:hypothetical protein B0H34DRAFT_440207 [Crassisporium funariophilum]